MASAYNTRLVSHLDCPGGGQVWVEGRTLYVGHMRPTSGTTIVDIADPYRPRILARIDVPEGWHSHKVRVANDVMLVNREKFGKSAPGEIGGGLFIYDVARPNAPKLIAQWMTIGGGVHRFDFDGRYAYISPTAPGYVGNIVMILDLLDPTRPAEVGRWWIPGQWQAGGEDYPWHGGAAPRCHHPLRVGDRLYVSYWHHGFFILDIADMTKPKLIAQLNTSPAFPHPTHTCLVVPQLLKGRKIMIVADEDVAKLRPAPPAFAWVFDITDEAMPIPIATFQVPGLDPDGSPQQPMTGCHQPSERFTDHRRSRPDLSDRSRRGRGHHRNQRIGLRIAAMNDTSTKTKRNDVYPIGKKNPNLPFHPAVRAGDFIFVSGQVAKDADGNMISGTIEEETTGTIAAIARILAEEGASLSDVVRVTTYLEDTRDFGRYNKVFAEHFKDAVLARTTVEARAVINTKIEMDAIAYKPVRG